MSVSITIQICNCVFSSGTEKETNEYPIQSQYTADINTVLQSHSQYLQPDNIPFCILLYCILTILQNA